MRERIVGLTLLAAVVAITLFGVPLGIGAMRYYAAEERSDLSDDAEALVGSLEAGLVPGAPLPPVTDVRPDDTVALYGTDGVRLSGAGPDRLEDALHGAREGHRARAGADGAYLVALPVRRDDREVAVLRAARPDDDVLARITWTWAAMVGLAVAAVAASRWVAGRLARRMADPLEDLAADAARIGDGDFRVHGQPSGVVEIDAARRALQDTARRLDDLLARERAFSTEASHQLRTPVMRLRLQLEEAASLPPTAVAGAVDRALVVTDDLGRTVEELLRLAREPIGPTAPLPVGPLVQEAVARYAGPADRPVTAEVRDEGLRAAASEAAVRQILGVLLDNAVVHGTGAVAVVVRETESVVAVDVADEGYLPEGDDPFGRGSARLGHGIGLVLARRLAEAEGGRLRLRSACPTVFSLLLRVPAEDLP